MEKFISYQFLFYVLIGFIAQIIDGAIGMAYGVSCNSFLLSTGVPPALASASVKSAEVFTTFFSGLSHIRLGNVDKKLFTRLMIPGILGGIIGAYILTNLPADKLKPFISAYLLIMGIRIIIKAFREFHKEPGELGNGMYALGFVGGMMDAIGGGGWGPIVTSTLIARGNSARMTIGSVNASEFFVTVAQVITFAIFLTITTWDVILGLIVGGVIAAPLAAIICKKMDPKKMILIVGIFISLLSIRTIYLAVF